jgi:hypothetical protein
MFIAAMIVTGLVFGGLLGLVGLGLYISIMEPASPGEQMWIQGGNLTDKAGAESKAGRRPELRGLADRDLDGKLTRAPHA